MKKFVLVLVLSVSYFSVAQEPPKFPKYDAKNAAQIFYYNFAEVPKEIKVRDDATKAKTFASLRGYNDKVKKISFLNTPKLMELELTINSLGNQLYSNRDMAEMVQKKVQTIIIPIRDSIKQHEEFLNTDLKSFLSKKQFKKWLRYQRAVKKDLLPKAPKSAPRPPSNMNRRRNRQGMGGGRGGRRF